MALGLTQQIQTIMLINIAHCNKKTCLLHHEVQQQHYLALTKFIVDSFSRSEFVIM